MEKNKVNNSVMKSYEELYEMIQDTTNSINNFCGFNKLDSRFDAYSLKLMGELQKLSSELSNTAHEFEEHLAWD